MKLNLKLTEYNDAAFTLKGSYTAIRHGHCITMSLSVELSQC